MNHDSIIVLIIIWDAHDSWIEKSENNTISFVVLANATLGDASARTRPRPNPDVGGAADLAPRHYLSGHGQPQR